MTLASRSPTLGVIVVGNLYTLTGVSRMNRLLLRSLRTGGFDVLEVPLEDRPAVTASLEHLADFCQRHDRVVCIASHTVDRLPLLEGFLARAELSGAHRIALWHWEYAAAPDALRDSLKLFDEFWAVSRHAALSLRTQDDAAVRVFPVPIPTRSRPRRTKSDVRWPDRFTFLTVFDHLSLIDRKNPLGVIRAFREAFPEPQLSGPQLVVKSRSADRMPAAAEELQALAADRPDVTIHDSALTDERHDDLIAAADVLVSLHRAEGYGLALAQAMGSGTVAMATRWSGNLDYMTDLNSVLVPYRMVPVPTGLWNIPSGAEWAEPDVSAAAACMRRLVADPAWSEGLRTMASRDVCERHNVQRTADWLQQALAGSLPTRPGY